MDIESRLYQSHDTNRFDRGGRKSHPRSDDRDGVDVPKRKVYPTRESLDTEGKTKSFKRLFGRFAEKTSMQGVPYINNAKFIYAKVIWTILLLVCTTGMGLHLYYLVNQFLAFPKQTKIELGFNNLQFPAVTICNVNPIKNSKIHLASESLQSLLSQLDYSHLVNDLNAKVQDPFDDNKRRKRFVDDLEEEFNFSQFADYYYYYDYGEDYQFGGTRDERIHILEIFRTLYRDENRDTKIQMGHQLDEMMISCTMGPFKCYASNFTLLQHDVYGNCYTFQSDRLHISKSGPGSGLTMVLYMEKEEYLQQINEGYGARVLIHDSKTFPFPEEEGFYVASAAETQIGIKMVEIERHGTPYGECVTGDGYEARYGFKYTRPLCQSMCVQDNIFNKCGCNEDDSSEMHWQMNSKNLTYCQTHSEIACMVKEKADQMKNKDECQCINPCKNQLAEMFLEQPSSCSWQTEDTEDESQENQANPSGEEEEDLKQENLDNLFILKDQVCDRIPSQCQDAEDLYDLQDAFLRRLNYLKISIYYEDLNYEEIKESPEIEPAQFASDIGGAVGLWIGLSILSLFEVVQLCLECCAYAVHKCNNGNKKRRRKRKRNVKHVTQPGHIKPKNMDWMVKQYQQNYNVYSTDIDRHMWNQSQSGYDPQYNTRYQGFCNGPYTNDYFDI